MAYDWDDWRLDPDGDLLTRQGHQVVASRKVLRCIAHLLAQRHRVVGYDELSRVVWGHGGVSLNQLWQVILTTRRTLGDDGQSQRLIRTLPGLGYRWVGPLRETSEGNAAQATDPAATPQEPGTASTAARAPAPRSPGEIHSAPGERARNRRLATWTGGALALGLAAIAITFGLVRESRDGKQSPTPPLSPGKATNGSLPELWRALEQARFDDVARGLSILPPALAGSPDAQLLEIHLDIQRGRFDQAERKIALAQIRAAESTDPVRQARLFSAQALLNGVRGRPGRDVLAPARAAMQLLESAGLADQPSLAMGEALSSRGYGYMKTLDLEPAIQDLIAARKMLLAVGDLAGAANAADTLARIHMRTGRFHEALELMDGIASYARRANNPISELYARNAATKIQIELLRWDDALANSDRCMQILQSTPATERKTRVLQLRALLLTGVGRMREADSLIQEIDSLQDQRYSPIMIATHRLAAGDMHGALQAASDADRFDRYSANDMLNLESREGALLLWLTAARALAKSGEAGPPLTTRQRTILQSPGSSIGQLARGHWLWSQARQEEAEAAFREAYSQARRQGHLGRMLAATEALVELRLERGDRAAAEQALAELWGYAPQDLAKDYRANVLTLRLALATGNRSKAASVHRTLAGIAGERRLPAELQAAYVTLTALRNAGGAGSD